MKVAGIVAAIALTAVAAGCTSFRAVEASAGMPGDETIFILGVSPAHYRVKVFPGTVRNGIFRESGLRLAAYYGAPRDGYVVGKAKPGDTLAITLVREVANEDDVLGRDFVPCAGLKTMVFKVPQSGVFYLGDVTYSPNRHQLEIRYSGDAGAAQSYLASRHPSLGSTLGTIEYELLPVQMACSTEIYIPIYL
ncbi:MAG: hypothetical protein LCH70_04915 [Proteobacteria bacterium]|nr:hypothetical protein [Pseudomonadota bacterium]